MPAGNGCWGSQTVLYRESGGDVAPADEEGADRQRSFFAREKMMLSQQVGIFSVFLALFLFVFFHQVRKCSHNIEISHFLCYLR